MCYFSLFLPFVEVLLQTYIHILQLKINEENSEKRKEQDIIQIATKNYDEKADEHSRHSHSEPNAEAWTECKDFSRYCISAK